MKLFESSCLMSFLGYLVETLFATDRDTEEFGHVMYYIVGGNKLGHFNLSSESVRMTSYSLHQRKQPT